LFTDQAVDVYLADIVRRVPEGGGRRIDANPGGPLRETIPIHEALARWLPQAALIVAAAALTGCTMTPWTDSWQPVRPSTPMSAATPGVIAGYYRVNPGDTLAGIAAAYGQRVQDLASWNRMSPNDAVSPGQVLRVAPPPAATSLGQPSTAAQPGSLAWPATGSVAAPFSAGRTRGITIAASGPDHSVRAAANGRVVYAGSGVKAYGPLVILKHDNGLITEDPAGPISAEQIAAGEKALASAYPAEAVKLYFSTLLAQDPDTWKGLAAHIEQS